MAEGSVWEALEIAAHYKLNNLIAVLDVNRLGQRGETIIGHHLEVYKKKAEAFGWQALVIDGHNLKSIVAAYQKAGETKDRPTMIIAKTFKGKGVSIMENKDGWHGKPLNAEQLTQALLELGMVDVNLKGKISKPKNNVIPSEVEGSPSLSQLPGDFSTSLRSGRNDIAGGFERIHMRDLWKKFVGVNLDEYLTKEKMFGLCVSRGYKPEQSEEYEDLFSRIFIDEVEPYLGKEKPLIVHHYPMSMAALSRQSQADSGYAERFEVYIDGLELANAYCEITDADVIEERLKTEKIKRAELGRDVFEVDREFVEAVRCMPESAGISLGIDRLVQLFTGCKNIDDVLVLPMSELMNQ